MSRDDDRLVELGRRMAEALGPGPGAERLFFQQDAIVAAAARRRRRWALLALPALVTAGAVFGLLVLFFPPEDQFGFRVKGEQPSGTRVELVAAAERLPVDFEDGSRLDLLPGSAAQILESSPRRVAVLLDRGALDADVRRADGRSWSIGAGPYTVHVLGTAFSVSWAPERSELEVEVSRGAVRVEGPGPAGGTVLSAGQRFSSSAQRTGLAQKTASPFAKSAPAALSRPAVEPPAQPPGAAPAAPLDVPEANPDRSAPPGVDSPLAAWRLLHHVGEYRSALAAVGGAFGDLLDSLGPDDLWRLAETCRLARDGERARRALLSFRKRFPQSPRAPLAAFMLASVAMDLLREPASALDWFETYLAEDPAGALAEEALGRSIRAASDAGQPERARDIARRYLSRFPGGAYTEAARSVSLQ